MRSTIAAKNRVLLILASLLLTLLVLPAPGSAQGSDDATGLLPNETPLPQRLATCIEHSGGIDAPTRQQMQENLRQCLQAGVAPERLVGLFPLDDQPHLDGPEALRAQATVISALAAELPVDLVLTKVQEGCRKGVDPDRIIAAAERMVGCLSTANHFINEVADAGLGETPHPHTGITGNVALHVWGGLTARDLEKLKTKGQERLRDHTCTLDDIVAASGCAANLVGGGASHDGAVGLVGEALGLGLSPQQMREMTALVAAARTRTGQFDNIMTQVRQDLNRGLGTQEMAQQMLRAGWLGPADMPGAGGHGLGPSAGPGSPGYPGGAGQGPGNTSHGMGNGSGNAGGGGGSSGGGRVGGR